MTRQPFVKMHGLGNDFIVLDAREIALPHELTPDMVAALADRKTGIGCDQFIVLEPSSESDLTMRIFNADGGEVEACGNASRAVAVLLGKPASVATSGAKITLQPTDGGASVDMGVPRFEWADIPLDYAMDTSAMPVSWEMLRNPAAVNVGNPHVVFFVPDTEAIDLSTLGPVIENDPLFPERINVNVATIHGEGSIGLRVWERGVGLTRACGTGACATAVIAIQRKLVSSPVTVSLPGGDLQIAWEPGSTIVMTGPATESFRGEFDWDDFA